MNADAEPWFWKYIGAIIDDEIGLRVVLPFAGAAKDRLHEMAQMKVWYDERGVDHAAGLDDEVQFPRGGQSSERRFYIALDAIIEQRVRPDKAKATDGAIAAHWSKNGNAVSDDSVKAARLEHAAKASNLLRIWVSGARGTSGIVSRTDAEILGAYQLAIRANIPFYPADEMLRGRRKG